MPLEGTERTPPGQPLTLIGPRYQELLLRLQRIQGQARSIEGMIQRRGDSHAAVLMRLRSLDAAVHATIHELLWDHLDVCLNTQDLRLTEIRYCELFELLRQYAP